jgi:hypothetical protein
MRTDIVRRSLLVACIFLTQTLVAGCHDNSSSGPDVVGNAVATGASPSASAGSKAVTLSWRAPTENSNGSQLTNLSGYKIYYGESSGDYSSSIQVANPTLTTYVVENLARGHYYFALTSYTSSGEESGFSPEVDTSVD